ncbi:MAG TPA: T9SS type A sorting domain-containing protein, partial [Bacteroidales bacterium]|nr:T9SS type A sorting domain-containing protein [Bacteroidales bacterium]
TDINGEATIDLPNGTYPYAVSAPTTQIINGEVIVNGENQVVQIDLSVGINESHSSDVNIYPVPVTSILNINKKGYVAQIIDMTGSVVYNSNIQTTQIDMRSLPAGRYIIRLINKKEVITKTITKL